MKTIWKCNADGHVVDLPKGAKAIYCHMQAGHPMVWLTVDPEAEGESRCFTVYGTGAVVPEDGYVGTMMDGAFVWHVYES